MPADADPDNITGNAAAELREILRQLAAVLDRHLTPGHAHKFRIPQGDAHRGVFRESFDELALEHRKLLLQFLAHINQQPKLATRSGN